MLHRTRKFDFLNFNVFEELSFPNLRSHPKTHIFEYFWDQVMAAQNIFVRDRNIFAIQFKFAGSVIIQEIY